VILVKHILLLSNALNVSLFHLFSILNQASSPLQVKYADGELERLGMMLS
jgi:hypothetical protein